MSREQFERAVTLANSELPLAYDNISIFSGFSLKGFPQIATTIKDLAALIRWQSRMLNGEMDNESLTEIWQNRHKFIVTG